MSKTYYRDATGRFAVEEDLRKFDKWTKDLQKSSDRHVLSVGILQPEASIVYKSGATMGQIASWNEFGTPDIPARPFMRQTFRTKKDIRQGLRVRVRKSKSMGVSDGTDLPIDTLEAMGQALASAMKSIIAGWKSPKNAEFTIKKKGKDDPLVETGLMMKSVRYEVKKRGT